MRKFFMGFVFLGALSFSGCKTDMISVKAIQSPLIKVLDRHDAYVKADKTLSDLVRQVYLKTSELLRKLLKEAASD
ncbi:MAG: hypothetical protein DRG33_06010 [Deltaproteobacteria bacterium]|nr:MAG: hypothetical protein DRG33_06010 [Deltaproteobacteria bacterium]